MRQFMNIICEAEAKDLMRQFDEWVRLATAGKVGIEVLDNNQKSFCLIRTDGDGKDDTFIDGEGAEQSHATRYHYNLYDVMDRKLGKEKLEQMLRDALTLAKAVVKAPEPEKKMFEVGVTDGTQDYAPKVPALDEETAKMRALKYVERKYGEGPWEVYRCSEITPE